MRRGSFALYGFVIVLVFAVCVVSVVVVNNSSGKISYPIRTGMCCCHEGSYIHGDGSLYHVDCKKGITGEDVRCLGSMSKFACIDICGRDNHWWCSP